MNRFPFNHPIWPSNREHLVSVWLASGKKKESICGTLQDQMLKKALTRQVSELFLLSFFSFLEPFNEGDPGALWSSGDIERNSTDASSRLRLGIKQAQVCTDPRLIHHLDPVRNNWDCKVKKKTRREERRAHVYQVIYSCSFVCSQAVFAHLSEPPSAWRTHL